MWPRVYCVDAGWLHGRGSVVRPGVCRVDTGGHADGGRPCGRGSDVWTLDAGRPCGCGSDVWILDAGQPVDAGLMCGHWTQVGLWMRV